MSIRTKLLAAILGLNGILLILALFLFLQQRDEDQAPFKARADLMRLGMQIDDPHWRDGQAVLERHAREGIWQATYVVLEAGLDADRHPEEVYPAAEFFRTPGERPKAQVADGDLREQLSRLHVQARLSRAHLVAESDGTLVVIPTAKYGSTQRGFSIVAFPAASDRGARTIYVAMIAGVVLLAFLAFRLLSRWVIHPLRRLAAGAERVAVGEQAGQIPILGTGDEIDRTIAAFNAMSQEVAEYQGQLEDRVLSALGRIKKTEKHLAIAQRLAATGKLAAGLAHEINNPLGGLQNATRALTRGDLDDDKTREYLALIDEGLARIEQTVKRFLRFTPRKLEARRADMAEVATNALAMAEHRLSRRRIQVTQDLSPPGEATVFGDAHELQQVLLNLLLNAGDAAPEDGSGRIHVGLAREGEEILLRIRDNGHGMSPEDQDRCFDMFFTTKAMGEGTGLGLAVVHNIVTGHGGRIDLTSQPGEGTTFLIRLPVDHSGPEDEAPAAPAPAAGTPVRPDRRAAAPE